MKFFKDIFSLNIFLERKKIIKNKNSRKKKLRNYKLRSQI